MEKVEPRIGKSVQGRLRWQPGDEHPLDALFPYASAAQEELARAVARLQESVHQLATHELALHPEALAQALELAEVQSEQTAYTLLKDQKHYYHAQALLAYLRRQQMAARLQTAQAAVDLAMGLVASSAETLDPPDLWGHLGSARDWRKLVAQFEARLTEVREQAQRSEGWFETKVVRRGKRLHGPYLVYRWRETDGRVCTVHLGRTDEAHSEAPAEFVAGAWAGYEALTKRRLARSPEELLLAGLRRLVEQSAFRSRSDRKFGKSLWEQSKVRPLSVPQLRALYSMLTRYQPTLEAGEEGIALPDPERLRDYLAEREAAQATAQTGQIDADGKTYRVRFPYHPAQVGLIRAIWKKHGGQGWQRAEEAWLLSDTAGPDLFAAFPAFERTEAALALHATMQAEVQAREEAEARLRAEQEQERLAWAAFRQQQLQRLDLAQPLKSGRVLYAHQREAVRWLLAGGKGILADDLGLGKTTSSLVAAKAFELPILVICPVTLKDNWLAEARLVDVRIQPHSWAKIPEPPETDFVLICDEAHYAQTWDAQRTQAMLRLACANECRGVFLLSGTPVKHGRPANLYPLLSALDHPLARDKTAYEIYFCAARRTPWRSWDISGAAHLDELHQQIGDVLLRRRKHECLDLPPKTRVRRRAEVSPDMRASYEETLERLRADYQRRVQAGEILDKGELLVALNQLRYAGSLVKTETALALVEELHQQEQQVVVFVDFVDSAKRLIAGCEAEGIKACLLIGETPEKERAPLVAQFQSGQVRVLVATLETGGIGLTLTAASTVILHDRPWSSEDAKQAEDRLHRIGQTNPVTAIWLAFEKIDQWIDDLLEQKAERIGHLLGEEASLSPLDHLDELARLLFSEHVDVVSEQEA